MQSDEVDLVFTPSILESSSLLTPDIVSNGSSTQSTYNPLHTLHDSLSSSQSSLLSINETHSSVSSADVKVSKIEDQLKQSFIEPRKPTPSPFEKISSGRTVFNLDKSIPAEDTGPIDIPSTADVVKELEAMTNTSIFQVKTLINENNERDAVVAAAAVGVTLNGDHTRYDSPPPIKGSHVSPPKKSFLIRSQSHTEPSSPPMNNSNASQSQKINLDNGLINTQNGLEADSEAMDDLANNPFSHTHDVMEQQFKPAIDNPNDQQQYLNSLLKMNQNGHPQPIVKQQPVVINNNNNKRPYANNPPSMPKANTTIIPPPSSSSLLLNEVTSTDQSSHVKRQRTATMPNNTTVMNLRPTFPSATVAAATVTNSVPNTMINGGGGGGGSDDSRKKQIRDSNREAARRCRERRRQYIEQLEGNLEQHKAQIKQLSDKLSRIERENTQLRAILSETKILHTSSRLSLNEPHVDYANVISASGIDLQSDSTDGGTITRSYINRNNL